MLVTASTFRQKLCAAMVFALVALGHAPAHAALKCEELMNKRACSDGAPVPYTLEGGTVVMIEAPVIDGFGAACWRWNRQFQCVESDATYSCESGTAFNTVKNNCNLTEASVAATVKVNAITYITDATYTYRCEFGEFTSPQNLPEGKDCVVLEETIVDLEPAPAALAGTMPVSPVPPSTSIATKQERTQEFVCYSPPQTTCSDVCYEQVVDAATGTIQQKEVACTSPVSNCTTTSNACDGTASFDQNGQPTGGTQALGPDGRCVASTSVAMCQAGDIPRCLEQENCTLSTTAPSSVMDNGVALEQEQTYICSNTETSCAQYTTVNNCVSVGAWGWDNMSLNGAVGAGLGEANSAMSRIEALEKGIQDNDPYIFSGENLRCHYAIGNWLNTAIAIVAVIAMSFIPGGGLLAQAFVQAGMTATQAAVASAVVSIGSAAMEDAPNSKAFGSDCCKDYVIEGSDAWFKLGACNADEVRLAVARRKDLDVYLGQYCSKKSGFPVKQCVEKTKSYCVFDDMLALVVNEQGRQQLDAIASADLATTKATAAIPFSLYSDAVVAPTSYAQESNGHWMLLANENKSQIWAWQYPAYCETNELQSAAYSRYVAELNAITDFKGTQPADISAQQYAALIVKLYNLPSFQECPATPGLVSLLTCSLEDDSCDAARLPEGPSGVEVDISGTDISAADVNWRVQDVPSFYLPGDYGVTAVMPADSSFAAVSKSVNEYITSTGSCHRDGDCLYQFSITDKTVDEGMGARKRVVEYVQFPLYTLTSSVTWPAITYLDKDGNLDMAAYLADPNRGKATPTYVSNQRFVFHPIFSPTAPAGNIHAAVLLDWAYTNNNIGDPSKLAEDYQPLLVPTSLPPGTAGWYPYGDPADNDKHFYISGGCDANSRWCSYTIEADINVPRHPWGTAKQPRCWGFSLQQLAALDFDKMDLSRWINSLNLDSMSANMSTEAAEAMSNQVTASAQSFYSAYSSGESVANPVQGTVALVTNTDVLPKLSNADFEAYMLEAGVPANWPQWYEGQANNNPVSNVRVDWGDGSPVETIAKHSEGRAYLGRHDYGDNPAGRYKLTVTLDTAGNGTQTLSTYISITPDNGQTLNDVVLDFGAPGGNTQGVDTYVPSSLPDGTSQALDNVDQLSPGTAVQYELQGSSVTK